MCDPMMLSQMSAGGSVVGKLYEGISGFMSHSLSAEMAAGNAELLQKQAEIAAGNAKLAVTRGNYDEFLTRRKVTGVLASETAHYASGNVDPAYGSPLLIQGFSAAQGETDAQLIRARMMVERANALTQSANISGQAAGQSFKAASERGAAISSVVSSVLGAGTSYLNASSKWAPAAGTGSGDNPFLLNQPTDI